MEAVRFDAAGGAETVQMNIVPDEGVVTVDDERFAPFRQLRYANQKQMTKFDLLLCEKLGANATPPQVLKLSFDGKTDHATVLTATLPLLLVRVGAGVVVPLRLDDFRLKHAKGKRGDGSTATDRSCHRAKVSRLRSMVSEDKDGAVDLSSLPDGDAAHNDDAAPLNIDLSSETSTTDDDATVDDDDDDDDEAGDADDASDFSDFSLDSTADDVAPF